MRGSGYAELVIEAQHVTSGSITGALDNLVPSGNTPVTAVLSAFTVDTFPFESNDIYLTVIHSLV